MSIDWINWMSEIENQECGNCWAHAATGCAEGLLHKYYGQNIGIDLDEMQITTDCSLGSGCNGAPLSANGTNITDKILLYLPYNNKKVWKDEK